jgi:hypothetical protein
VEVFDDNLISTTNTCFREAPEKKMGATGGKEFENYSPPLNLWYLQS